jgi:hypothetical protein
MQSGGASVDVGLGLGDLVGDLDDLLGDLLAVDFFFGFLDGLADAEAFELGDDLAEDLAEDLEEDFGDDLGDAVGEGSGVGQTRASPVSLLTMRCASDSDSAAMPAATCSLYTSDSDAVVTSLTSSTWCMLTPGTSAWTPR